MIRLWKSWLEIRSKFWLTVGVVALSIGLSVIITGVISRGMEPCGRILECSSEAMSAFEGIVFSYLNGSTADSFFFFVIVLAVGGILTESNGKMSLLTASLPIRRTDWLFSHSAMVAVLAFVVSFCLGLEIVLVAGLFDIHVEAGLVFAASAAMAASSLIWIWPAMLATWITGDGIRGALLTIVALVLLALLDERTESAWHPFTMAGVTTWNGFPWEALVTTFAAIAVSSAVMVVLYRRADL